MSKFIISGIQQLGVGVSNVHEAFKWYRHHFGMDIKVFEEAATAGLMLPYTGGEPRDRHAILAMNLQGGGGFEIWQYTSRTPEGAKEAAILGDTGIFSGKIKAKNVQEAHAFLKGKGVNVLGEVSQDPSGQETFFVQDPYGNLFQIVPGKDWFGQRSGVPTGGPAGAWVGVTDIEKARVVYSEILGYDEVIYDKEGHFDDLKGIPGGEGKFRRVLLGHKGERQGPFSKLMGSSAIELVVALDRTPKKIFEGRFWGDLGFIHLCFDMQGMKALKETCEAKGFPFTVDSGAHQETAEGFDMGEAAGHFSYIEDPDGTLIEFVETHKVPAIKAIGFYINLKKRPMGQRLPNWMLKAMRFSRVKD